MCGSVTATKMNIDYCLYSAWLIVLNWHCEDLWKLFGSGLRASRAELFNHQSFDACAAYRATDRRLQALWQRLGRERRGR